MTQHDFIAAVIGNLVLEKAALLEQLEQLKAKLAEQGKQEGDHD